MKQDRLEESIFYNSLICCIKGENVILTLEEENLSTKNASIKRRAKHEISERRISDTYNQLFDVVSAFSYPGTIRSVKHFQDFIHVDIKDNKYCSKSGRIHSKNNTYYRYNIKTKTLMHGCYSNKCKGKKGFTKIISLI